MRKSSLFILSILPALIPQAALSQGIMEAGAANAMSASMGSGLMGSLKGGYGAGVQKTYQSGADSANAAALMSPAQALQMQNQAADQYTKVGAQYVAKKQWTNAEKSYEYVLKVSVLRDGPGSSKAIPTLQRLADVCAAQGKIKEAIAYQERVVGLLKNLKPADATRLIGGQVHLAEFYSKEQDNRSAEQVLKEAYLLAEQTPSLPYDKRRAVTKPYASVLRSLHKDDEALKVEPPPIELTPLVISPKNREVSSPSTPDTTSTTATSGPVVNAQKAAAPATSQEAEHSTSTAKLQQDL